MGLCRDFGSQIAEGCDHPMRAGSDSCHCEQCGVVCTGKFEACPAVWALGQQPVVLVSEPAADMLNGPNYGTNAVNGHEAPAGHPVERSVAGEAKAATNGQASVPSSPPPAAQAGSESAAEAFRWFQNAFDALRQEVAGLRSALAQEQTLVATLLEVKVAETTRDTESERTLLETTVREAVKQEARGIGPALEALRNDIEVVRSAQTKLEADLQAGLGASLQAGLRAVADAAEAARVELPAELSRRESANRKALRATLGQEFQPLIEVVAESVAQSEYQLQALDRKLDSLTKSGASLAAAVAEVAESVEELAAEDTDPEPEPPRVALRPRSHLGMNQPAARTSATPAAAASVRRLPLGRPAIGNNQPAAGRRVSLRNQPSDD